jgi:predicted nucleic-acid-binding protein
VIGLDTNVLVRYLTQDDEQQAVLSSSLIDGLTPEAPGFLATVALVETTWVLAKAYGMSRTDIAAVVEGLLRSRELLIEDAETHYLALGAFQAGPIDYADAVIAEAGRSAGCAETVTFDRRAAASGRMRLVGD